MWLKRKTPQHGWASLIGLKAKILVLYTSVSGFVSFKLNLYLRFCHIIAGGLVLWLKLPAWKVGDRGFRP